MYSRYLYSFQGRKRRRKDRGLWATLAERNSMETQNTIGIAGVGKMGEALVRGLIVGRVVPASRVLVSDAIPARAKEIAAKHGVTSLETVADLARESDILVLAAKPKDMPSLVAGIAAHVKRDALVITLAAGVRTAFVEKALNGRGRVVRIMPNLACAVGEGATAFALGRSATEHDALVVEEIFGAIGRVTMVDEPMLDAVTGLSGSGPGFIAALAHSMIEGGVRSGLPRDVAYKLALQTMKGTAELLLIDGLEPMQLFRMVATPNGTTEAGWAVMEKRGVPPAISDAIVAASKRAAELAAEVAKAHG
ncbi:MAG: pyrroline-5-carboxylate reductase [Methanobacteriota archaeon]|nr:MAG: pyrroline-5-carboxylate reductase [Euryarchaeota archaeon]